MKIKNIILSICLAGIFAGCGTWNKLNDTERGAVIGGGTGAIVGQVVAPGGGGALVGGALGAAGGGLIGHERDRDQRKKK